MAATTPFASLPSVNDVLACAGRAGPGTATTPTSSSSTAVRHGAGRAARSGSARAKRSTARSTPRPWPRQVVERLGRELRPKLRPVINATGIVLHTNLGRAPMAEEAAPGGLRGGPRLPQPGTGPGNAANARRGRLAIREWVCRLTGAESATAVNNNAAATVIVLRALCQGKEVIISRGQLIEIGGSFRIPEIMAVSGAILREVGTTNITRLADYERAIGPNTGALLQVHTSNYRISGFTEVGAAGRPRRPGQEARPAGDRRHRQRRPARLRAASASRASRWRGPASRPGPTWCCSAATSCWAARRPASSPARKERIQKIEKDPLMRAFRLDKMTLAALEATLRLYLNEDRALREVPVLRMLGTPLTELRQRAEALAVAPAQISAGWRV